METSTGWSMEWPEHFPQGCPPPDAMDAEGPFFRIVTSDPPTEGDFKTHWELGREGPPCLRHGLSGFRTFDEVALFREVIPGFRKRRVARAELKPELGKLKNTPTKNSKGHHTWWVPEGIIRLEQYFVVI